MGKIIYGILTAFAIELALSLFGGNTFAHTSLFNLLINPSSVGSSTFYLAIVAALAVISATVIIVGSFYNFNIYAVYAGISAILITFALSIADLWTFINGQLNVLQITSNNSSLIATLVVSPILIAYIIMTVDYMRGTE